jgi:ribosome recycling factor
MLDHIMVETADVKVGLNRIAVVSVLDSHTLSVMPYDPSVRTFLPHTNSSFHKLVHFDITLVLSI